MLKNKNVCFRKIKPLVRDRFRINSIKKIYRMGGVELNHWNALSSKDRNDIDAILHLLEAYDYNSGKDNIETYLVENDSLWLLVILDPVELWEKERIIHCELLSSDLNCVDFELIYTAKKGIGH